jgi:hypothetical protein
MKICISMSLEEARPLLKKVNGKGGFQSLLKRLQLDAEVVLRVSEDDLVRMSKMSTYVSSGFKSRMPTVSKRRVK